jgi:multidrug efflux pump subunit AcrB
MALNISAWSIRNPLPSIVFSIILLVLGWVSFTKLAVTRLPSADIPVISVAVSQFGAAPSELESQVTKTIEDGVSGVEGVRHISSSITDGLSLTTIQFALETNTDRALNDVKDAITRVRANLPQNVTEPLIQRVDVIGLPIVTYAAISPGKTPEQLSYFVDDVVKRALQGVRNVAQVERIGGVEREILVSLDPDRLQASGLTAVNVSQILRGTNVDVAGGRAEIGKNDQAIRTLAGAKTLNELAGTMIPLFSGGEVRLDDLGTVTDTIADRRTFARFNGEPVVALGIKRSKGASDVVVAAAVQKRIDALKATYPDVDLKLIDTSVDFTKGNYEAAISTLFEGAVLASSSCCCSCATCAPPSSPRSRCRCRSSRRSGRWTYWASRLTSSPSSPSRCRQAYWSTTPSSRSRTSCGICGWANRPIARRWKPPTKSASR